MGEILRRHGKFYLRYYGGNGKRKQEATACKNERQAEKLLRERETEAQKVRDGRLPQPLGPTDTDKRKQTITVAELTRMFLGEVEGEPGYAPPKIKSVSLYRRDARVNLRTRLPASLTESAAASIRMVDIERIRDRMIAKELAAASVMQVLAALSKLYEWSRRAGYLDCANPVRGVERPKPAVSLDYLDKEETARLLAKAEELATAEDADHTARARWPMVVVAVFCGLRKGELFGLRWRDVALDAKRLDVLKSYRLAPKSGKPRHLPMHPEVDRALRWWRDRCPKMSETLVFPTIGGERGKWHMGEPQDMFEIAELLEAAECHPPADGKPWHFMRHTFASHAVMSGASLYDVQRILGHSTSQMTQRYAHLAPDHLAGAVARLSFPAPTKADVTDISEERRKRAVAGVDGTETGTGA